MLLEFKVGNFLSFKDVQVLRLAQVLDNADEGTKFGNPSQLMFIYGPNNAGKSNLIKAMSFSKDLILNGYSAIQPKRYFNKKGPSYFEYVISINDIVYSYGFEIKLENMCLCSEWLYILDSKMDSCLYEYEIPYDSVSHANTESLICNLEINSDNHRNDHFSKVREWIQYSLSIIGSRICDTIIPVSNDFIEILESGLKNMDTGITKVIADPFLKTEIPTNLIRKIPNKNIIEADGTYIANIIGDGMKRDWIILISRLNGISSYYNISLIHQKYVPSTMACESLGTMRIITILELLSKMKSGGTVIIDEIECSVHTLVVGKLIDVFKDLSGNNAQMISTTHKTSILCRKDLGEECYYFIDTDRSINSGSRLYSMKSIDKHFEDRRRAYFDGRMAAIPYFIK